MLSLLLLINKSIANTLPLSSILDILINEVANVLGLTPEQVKEKFTESELNDLLNSSLCEPAGDIGIPLDSEAPCNDLAIPNLLPPIEDFENKLDELANKVNTDEQNKVTKCIDKVEETNILIEKQIDLYTQHRVLYDKLLEYRDNYLPVVIYYDERAKEAARILNQFEPILTELRRLETIQQQLEKQYQKAVDDLASLQQTLNIPAYSAARQVRDAAQKALNENSQKIGEQNVKLKGAEQSVSIFSNDTYRKVLKDLDDSTSITTYLKQLFDEIFSSSQISSALKMMEDYAEGLSFSYTNQKPTSLSNVFAKTYFNFELKFPGLDLIRSEREKFNKETGESYLEPLLYLIKNSPLLQKNSFFQSTSSFSLSSLPLENRELPSGRLYQNYYNLFEDPVNNFFSLEERGLTSNPALVDPNLKGTGGETKKEKDIEYFIQNLETLQNFYKDFDNRLELKKAEKRAQFVEPVQNAIRTSMSIIAKREVQAVLALSRVNLYLPNEDQSLKSALDQFNSQNSLFLRGLEDLDSELTRLKEKIDELKPDPIKIKKLLKEKSPECFEKIDQPIVDDPNADCSSAKEKLGSDPFFIDSLKGCDPTLPNQNQLCYWFEFSKIATLVGMVPIPNISPTPQLRYWPVGFVIPSPAGLIKIPLPIIWLPLVVFSTPLGNIVLFLTINGIFISPVVFLVSSSGFKQHIITIKGPSKKFGYSSEDASIKPGIQFPAILLATRAKADRLAKEASLGKDYLLSEKEKLDKAKQASILAAAASAADLNNNDIRKAKVKREKTNFERATANLTDAERLAEIVDKTDSLTDIIDDAKQAVLNRIDELGRPVNTKINDLKNKIVDRQNKLLTKLQSALISGNESEISRIRSDMANDGIALTDKVAAIKSDAQEYFDKIKLPKVTIPKDTSTIDPKLNALVEFIRHIREFSSVYRTQFFSKDDSRVQKILLIQLAKQKQKIKNEIKPNVSADGFLDIELETDKIREVLKKVTAIVVGSATGTLDTGSASNRKKEVDDLTKKIKAENDPAQRARLRSDLQSARANFSEALDNERTKFALSLTPATIAGLSQISVDFNPFAPCCKKKPFTLELGISPAVPVFESVISLINLYIDSLSTQSLISLFGGKTKISAQDMTGAYLGIIKRSVPASLQVPLPNLNLLTFAASFSSMFTALFEIKVPNFTAQPALPTSITIDLNLLKKPLLTLFLTFLENSLPDPRESVTTLPQSKNSTAPLQASGNEQSIAQSATDSLPNPSIPTTVDDSISIITCDSDTSGDSLLTGGNLSTKNNSTPDLEETFGVLNSAPVSNSSNFSSGNVIVNSNKDILPNFQTLDLDFLSVNPADIVALIKNFIDLKFDSVQDLLDPFYSLLKTVQGLKGTNLNLLESIQYTSPPYGPPAQVAFVATTNLKKQIPKSATLKIIDPVAVEAGAKTLKSTLGPIANSPLPAILVAGAGAADAKLPSIKTPSIDSQTGAISTKDARAASLAIRSLHPLLSQEDLPPWERLTVKNVLFLLFLDEFVANCADKVGFFRSFV